MKKSKQNVGAFALLRQGINAYISHPVILTPFLTLAFIQILVLEILYFAPRYPLSLFFGPIIEKFWGEAFLHYPLNFAVIPKLFQPIHRYIIFIFISSFMTAVTVRLVQNINHSHKASFGQALRKTFSSYIHIVLAAVLTFLTYSGFSFLWGLVINRAREIRSTEGVYFLIKTAVIKGTPFVNLLLAVCVTVLFAYVIPLIVTEQRKFISAFLENFRVLFRSFFTTLFVVFLPTVLYLPIFFLRSHAFDIAGSTFPGMSLLIIMFSMIFMALLDATIYVGITLNLLYRKQTK